jgi:hypothetical protein
MLFMELLEQHGKPRFVVLLTDMLLILKPKKKMKMNMVQSKLGAQMPQLDWFSDLGCKAKRVSTIQTLVPCIPSLKDRYIYNVAIIGSNFHNIHIGVPKMALEWLP